MLYEVITLRTEAEAGSILRVSVRTDGEYGVASAVQELLLPPETDGRTEVRLSRWLPAATFSAANWICSTTLHSASLALAKGSRMTPLAFV